MGTNYYLRMNICSNCGRYDELHIGKSSGGWRFMFHGYRELSDEVKFSSYSDLLQILNTGNYQIYDEYQELISISDFLSMVKEKQKLRSQFPSLGTDNAEVDSCGFEFYFYDFS
jgi:hypothetical protein